MHSILELMASPSCTDEALKNFKEISKLERPPTKAGKETTDFLGTKLQETYYYTAGDAASMVDVTPGALGVPADPVRIFLHKNIDPDQQSIRSNRSTALPFLELPPKYVKDKDRMPAASRPNAVRISSTVDTLARLAVTLVGGAFLLAPMSALTFISTPKYQLITVVLFVMLFAVVLALGAGNASNQELLGATAAYAAVLVVFVHQLPASGS